MTGTIVRGLLGLSPVLVFLAVLVLLDSYKLVRLRATLLALASGALVALLSYAVNAALLGQLGLDFVTYSRYVSPVVEEILKGLLIVYLVRRARIGFPVDAAIYGFAIGTGFAVIENLYYLHALPDASLGVWVVRGFGTAIMHGGAVAIFGIVAHTLCEEHQTTKPAMFVPGLAAAIVVHSAFNHFLAAPILSTIGILVLLPPVILYVFERSERSLRKWMEIDFNADTELLELINSGRFSDSKVGQYLSTVRDRFRGEVIADMFCYLRLHVELSMRASGMLMLRESGFEVPPDPEVKGMLEELRFLERSIGTTGQLAMKPFLRLSSRDLWQLYMLEK
jgi:RsiW-degrading membrane proteinase PrsW (M82 family)